MLKWEDNYSQLHFSFPSFLTIQIQKIIIGFRQVNNPYSYKKKISCHELNTIFP